MNWSPQLFGILLVFAFSPSATAQETSNDFPYNLYQPSAISALAKKSQKLKAASAQFFLDGKDDKVIIPAERYRLSLSFVGEVRPLMKKTRLFLELFAKKFPHIPAQQWATYTHEIHVKEGSTDLWLPIQGQILPTLILALSSDKEFDAYVYWLGENEGQQICVINSARIVKK
jgi:hypothetical protein